MALFRVTYNVREQGELYVKRQFIVECSSKKSLENQVGAKEYSEDLNVFWEVVPFKPMKLGEWKKAVAAGDEGL